MTNENVRSRDVSRIEQGVKLPAGIRSVRGRLARIAPPVPRSIIDADPRCPGQFRLHPRPRQRRKTQAGFQDDRRRTASQAMNASLAAFNLDHLTVWPKSRRFGFGCKMLI